MVSIYTEGLDFGFQSISELWILNYVLYYDINIYIQTFYMIYTQYLCISIIYIPRFLQIQIIYDFYRLSLMIPIEAWRGRMGALTGSLPKEVSTVTMGVGGQLKYTVCLTKTMEYDCFRRYTLQGVVGWPTELKWRGLKIHGYRAKSDSFLWANLFTFFFLELEYDMDVRNTAYIYIYIYTHNVLTFGFFLTFGSFVLSWLRLRPHFTFLAPWQEQAQWDHVFDGEMKVQ